MLLFLPSFKSVFVNKIIVIVYIPSNKSVSEVSVSVSAVRRKSGQTPFVVTELELGIRSGLLDFLLGFCSGGISF